MAVVSVSLPDNLLAQTDRFIEERGYAGRSELVRACLRDFLGREGVHGGDGERTATLTLIYPDGFERKIGEIRHDFNDIVQAMMHGHTQAACVEVFMLSGEARRIRQFADALRAARETRLVEAVYTDRGED